MMSKPVPVHGNVCDNLVMDFDTIIEIARHVHLIVNSATNTTFDERQIDLVFISYGKDQLPGFIGNPKIVLDIVPVGIVVNAIIEVMAKHGIVAKAQLHVYRITSSVINPISFRQLFDFACDHFISFPSLNSKQKKIKEFKYFSSMDKLFSYIRDETTQQMGLKDILSTLDSKLRL
ncbi:hypothetical protein GH714_018398 [Hevea brasiliensis]|uniref:Fatty acyl-CoA reductase n=1 Tax=Hevea brasiliensis TaxID=3981 RepID=A0A6A6MA05_HEVBR|nr:hypothetical protein GH714_018398 [Hevea brasiliensis]